MELRNLQYFLKVAEHENMTKAAEELHVAQPALSRAVRLLEEELGGPLFDRNGKNIKLNYRGRVAKGRITMVFALIDDLYSAPPGQRSELELCLGTVNGPIMRIISDFQKVAPDIKVTVSNSRGNIKVVSGVAGEYSTGCAIFNEELFLAVPPDEQDYRPNIFSLADFADAPFILPLKSDTLRDDIDRLCRQAGFRPKVAYETDNPVLVEELVSAGMGVAFWPDVSWGTNSSGRTLKIHIQQPVCWRNIFITWNPDVPLTSSEERFVDFSADFFSAYPDSARS